MHLTGLLGALAIWAIGQGAYAMAAGPSPLADAPALTGFVNKIERKQLAASGVLPLAGTPELSQLDERLAHAGFGRGSPVLLRVFKAEASVELFLYDGARYQLFATYPICFWNGDLGPKLKRGDRQSPEGFFTVTANHLRASGHWNRGLDLGFPTPYEELQGHTGDGILIHGGCGSIGCIAMTDPVIEEIYQLARAALKGGQTGIPVHVFPFRMTDANMAAFQTSPWIGFWQELKPGYDAFERTHVPPRVGICNKRYAIIPGDPKLGADVGVSAACGRAVAGRGSAISDLAVYLVLRKGLKSKLLQARQRYQDAANTDGARRLFVGAGHSSGGLGAGGDPGVLRAVALRRTLVHCSMKLPSCRKWVALHSERVRSAAVIIAKNRRRLAAK